MNFAAMAINHKPTSKKLNMDELHDYKNMLRKDELK